MSNRIARNRRKARRRRDKLLYRVTFPAPGVATSVTTTDYGHMIMVTCYFDEGQRVNAAQCVADRLWRHMEPVVQRLEAYVMARPWPH
jgi:hypothetical protein